MKWILTSERMPKVGETVVVLANLREGLELRFATYDIYGKSGNYKPLWAIKSRTSTGEGYGGFHPLEVVARWLPVGIPERI
jgi:hypothetical protein